MINKYDDYTAKDKLIKNVDSLAKYVNLEINTIGDATQKTVKHPEIEKWNLSHTAIDDPGVLILLNTVKALLEASLVYIMNNEGTVIASTPHSEGKSITGKNYKFRPYFIRAMKGTDSVYLALGITTHKRGLYYSAPVFIHNNQKPSGVIVIKMGLERIDKVFNQNNGLSGLMSPDGIIFASNNKEWLFKRALPVQKEVLEKLRQSRQFADQPLTPLGVWFNASTVRINTNYLLELRDIKIPGWKVFTLHKIVESGPVYNILLALFIIIVIGILLIIISITSYKRELLDLQKKRIEANIEEWKNRYEAAVQASGFILYDWNSVTNEVTYGGNLEEILGYSIKEMNGPIDNWINLIHPEDEDYFKELINKLIDKKCSAHMQFRLRKKDGEYIFVEDTGNFFPDADGNLIRMVGFIKDISER